MSTNIPNDYTSQWNKIRNKSDCEITQPVTPELCYPKSATENNPFTEKLFKYRASRREDCNPTPIDPCILDHTGLILPRGVVDPVDQSIEFESVGNDLVVYFCEDFFSTKQDKDKYISFNGSYVLADNEEDTKDYIIRYITNLYKSDNSYFTEADDGNLKATLTLSRPNSNICEFDTITQQCLCNENWWECTFTKTEDGMITLTTNDNEGVVIVLPSTFVQQYIKGQTSQETVNRIKEQLTNNAIELAKTLIGCYVGNKELEEHCPGHESFDPDKSNIEYYKNYSNSEALKPYFNKEKGTTHVCKNRMRLTLDKPTDNNNEDLRHNIREWEEKYNEVHESALAIITSSLRCTYGNQPQTSYCVYPVLRSETYPTAVYGLYPGQTLAHNDDLSCAIAVDKLFPLSALTKVDSNSTGNKTKNIGYLRTKYTYEDGNEDSTKYTYEDGSQYAYFHVDPESGTYYFGEKIAEDKRHAIVAVPTSSSETIDIEKDFRFELWNSEFTNSNDMLPEELSVPLKIESITESTTGEKTTTIVLSHVPSENK